MTMSKTHADARKRYWASHAAMTLASQPRLAVLEEVFDRVRRAVGTIAHLEPKTYRQAGVYTATTYRIIGGETLPDRNTLGRLAQYCHAKGWIELEELMWQAWGLRPYAPRVGMELNEEEGRLKLWDISTPDKQAPHSPSSSFTRRAVSTADRANLLIVLDILHRRGCNVMHRSMYHRIRSGETEWPSRPVLSRLMHWAAGQGLEWEATVLKKCVDIRRRK